MTLLSVTFYLVLIFSPGKLSSVRAKHVTHVKTAVPQPAIAVKIRGGRSLEGFMA